MKSTEQKATIITLNNESIILLVKGSYIHLSFNEACSKFKIMMGGECHTLYPSSYDAKAIASAWRVLVPEAPLDALDKEYCDYHDSYNCDCRE